VDTVGIVGLVGFLEGLGALGGFEGPKDCIIRSSKGTIGFLDLLDRRWVVSSMIN